MGFLVGSSLKTICNVLKDETESLDLPSSRKLQLHDLLHTLNGSERFLVAKYFCKLPWNMGSLKMLSILQELRILTATEYILSCSDSAEVQLILNDFLESRFDLVVNLFINVTFDSPKSLRLNAILEQCLENLFKDLLHKPELNDLSFLNCVRNSTPVDIQLKIIHKLLSSILDLCQTSIKEAFCHFSSWINEGVDELKFPKDLCKKLLKEHIEGSLNYLLKCSSTDDFREWKFYIILLQTISSINNEIAGPYIRKYLKLRFKQCATIPCKRSIMHILLTARAATATTMDITKNLNNYAEWYKNNIGEMKFYLKAEEFQNILSILDQCINYEMEVNYLERSHGLTKYELEFLEERILLPCDNHPDKFIDQLFDLADLHFYKTMDGSVTIDGYAMVVRTLQGPIAQRIDLTVSEAISLVLPTSNAAGEYLAVINCGSQDSELFLCTHVFMNLHKIS